MAVSTTTMKYLIQLYYSNIQAPQMTSLSDFGESLAFEFVSTKFHVQAL